MSLEKELGNVLNAHVATDGVAVTGRVTPEYLTILTPEALRFVGGLVRAFRGRREYLLEKRKERQAQFDAGVVPDFLENTQDIRKGNWQVAAAPADLQCRLVEITGPASSRKMVINALNSGSNCYMADFEDSDAPTWANVMQGQINMRDAAHRVISHYDMRKQKAYQLNAEVATLLVRPRGWHLSEDHILVDGQAAPASLVDFGLYFFHNAHTLLNNGSGPYFYLPKLESHLEARLWNEVFTKAQHDIGVPHGSIRATVLIETITAAFEMEEILYELKEHSAGLNCGRWDYVFSYIKKFSNRADFVLPDRNDVGMDRHFLNSYVEHLIQTCHKRGAFAMGGMAANIPIKGDAAANAAAMEKVRADKEREARAGHDGTWVAHPGLVTLARDAFREVVKGDNQLHVLREEVSISGADLLQVPQGAKTYDALVNNISIGVQYLEAWIGGNGCVPLYHKMEDAATAEISRAQVWSWIKHGVVLEDGRTVTEELFHETLGTVMKDIKSEVGDQRYTAGCFTQAQQLFSDMSTAQEFPDFLTLPAYELIK